MAISLTAFRQDLYNQVKQVLADETGSLTISSKDGDVELVNTAELASLRELHHIFASRKNAARLLQGLEEAGSGEVTEVWLEELNKLAKP
ncbi:MAG: hypothetical protein P8M68_04295 [Aquiluna sp.]|nr:hypothetical protein [Aquiluna sp.]